MFLAKEKFKPQENKTKQKMDQQLARKKFMKQFLKKHDRRKKTIYIESMYILYDLQSEVI